MGRGDGVTGTTWRLARLKLLHYRLVLKVDMTGKPSSRFEARDDEPPGSPAPVDQLLRREARARPQVGEVALHSARPNTHAPGGARDGSACGNIGGQGLHLGRSRGRRECAAQVPLSHALRAVAGRGSLGVRLIITKRNDC